MRGKELLALGHSQEDPPCLAEEPLGWVLEHYRHCSRCSPSWEMLMARELKLNGWAVRGLPSQPVHELCNFHSIRGAAGSTLHELGSIFHYVSPSLCLSHHQPSFVHCALGLQARAASHIIIIVIIVTTRAYLVFKIVQIMLQAFVFGFASPCCIISFISI